MAISAITVENVSKRYELGEVQTMGVLGELFGRVSGKAKAENSTALDEIRHQRDVEAKVAAEAEDDKVLWALKDVSFEVPKGQVLGIIGRNGAGKSTLLKILSRITDPTEGTATIRGRIGSLLEVGTGFHPELTGRENVFLNGSILGMTRREIESRFNDIVSFSEIGRFIDTPVKRYSSGMFTRLAFSVAANLDPEILIIDEVLSVGDAAFQKKCLAKINALMRSGRTVIFVSHSMSSIAELCQSAILLHKGQMLKVGPIVDVIGAYTDLLNADVPEAEEQARKGQGAAILKVNLRNGFGRETRVFDLSDDIEIEIVYELFEEQHAVQTCLTLSRNMTEVINTFDTDDEQDKLPTRDPGIYKATHRLPRHFLKGGAYSVRVSIGTIVDNMVDIEGAAQFTIEELSENVHHRGYRKERVGHVISPGAWRVIRIG
jgi:lipopolysaccharide transport system ATP-binding protein